MDRYTDVKKDRHFSFFPQGSGMIKTNNGDSQTNRQTFKIIKATG